MQNGYIPKSSSVHNNIIHFDARLDIELQERYNLSISANLLFC